MAKEDKGTLGEEPTELTTRPQPTDADVLTGIHYFRVFDATTNLEHAMKALEEVVEREAKKAGTEVEHGSKEEILPQSSMLQPEFGDNLYAVRTGLGKGNVSQGDIAEASQIHLYRIKAIEDGKDLRNSEMMALAKFAQTMIVCAGRSLPEEPTK